jgi:hypothetical protein
MPRLGETRVVDGGAEVKPLELHDRNTPTKRVAVPEQPSGMGRTGSFSRLEAELSSILSRPPVAVHTSW